MRFRSLGVVFVVAGLAAACSSGGGSPGGEGGGGGTTGGGGSTGSGGTTGAGGTTSAGGTTGTGGATSTGGSGGSTGTGGTGGSGGTTSTGGSGGSTGTGGATSMGGSGGTVGAGGETGAGGFALTSTAFTAGMQVPLKYKCDKVTPVGMNISPPLSWTPGPTGTMSYAVTLNHVGGGDHWAIWDLPLTPRTLPEGIEHVGMPTAPAGSTQSYTNLDTFMGNGYLGPCPQGAGPQMYTYTVWALKVAKLSGVTAATTTTAAQAAIKAQSLASATLTGTQIQTP
ncbi:MAG TPA: YbhB/YbcL family Raf kinase inhibitor-like protein [Polyangia bacterium]|nr:YbhB/YbcL family Raf kinase inhibitor-like protein [Polyangia bacterium]